MTRYRGRQSVDWRESDMGDLPTNSWPLGYLSLLVAKLSLQSMVRCEFWPHLCCPRVQNEELELLLFYLYAKTLLHKNDGSSLNTGLIESHARLRLPHTLKSYPMHVSLNSVTRPSFKNLTDNFLTKWPRMSKVCFNIFKVTSRDRAEIQNGRICCFLDTYNFSSATRGQKVVPQIF